MSDENTFDNRVDITVGNVTEESVTALYVSKVEQQAYSVTFHKGVWAGGLEDSATFTLWTNDTVEAEMFQLRIHNLATRYGEDCTLVVRDYPKLYGAPYAKLQYS